MKTEGRIEKLLGIADPVKICSNLANLYPWVNEIFANVLTERRIPIFLCGAIDEGAAIDVMTECVHRLQSPDDHGGDAEWSRLASG